LAPKILEPHVTREKLLKALSNDNDKHRTLMKLTPCGNKTLSFQIILQFKASNLKINKYIHKTLEEFR